MLHAPTAIGVTLHHASLEKAIKPFQRLETDDQKHVMALQFLTSVEVAIPAVTSFICTLYEYKTANINEARYKAFISMSGGNMEKKHLARIKKKSTVPHFPHAPRHLDIKSNVPSLLQECGRGPIRRIQ